jgi:hypothetical protein
VRGDMNLVGPRHPPGSATSLKEIPDYGHFVMLPGDGLHSSRGYFTHRATNSRSPVYHNRTPWLDVVCSRASS